MINRRRVISIIASASAMPILPLIGAQASNNVRQWQGIALGANAQIILDHPKADSLIEMALTEINRLEKIFSLFDNKSQISVLNKTGSLENPAFELTELLSISSIIHNRTNGAFNPSVQPLWALYAKSYANGNAPTIAEINLAKAVSGWDNVSYSASQISFKKQGVAITLNGIAQGYIGDKIRELFVRNGVNNVLINTGEIFAMGQSPKQQDWQVKIANSEKSISLNNMAIATSATFGTVFDKDNRVSHIIDARTGQAATKPRQISVIAKSAAIADGLSTGFAIMNKNQIDNSINDEQVIFS